MYHFLKFLHRAGALFCRGRGLVIAVPLRDGVRVRQEGRPIGVTDVTFTHLLYILADLCIFVGDKRAIKNVGFRLNEAAHRFGFSVVQVLETAPVMAPLQQALQASPRVEQPLVEFFDANTGVTEPLICPWRCSAQL